ncbi:MAG: type II glyceraldehyde-3-phosphate dehydrogenase [Candidatus Aenigmatarchaeota archaeon]
MGPNIVVNGVGTVGKRVAHAVKKQGDMNLVGIADVSPSTTLRTVLEEDGPLHGIPLYASVSDKVEVLEEGGFYVEGDLPGFLDTDEVDVVVDCTPSGIDEKNKEMYEEKDVKAIFQGGADASIAPVSFNALANYDEAEDKDFVRVVSCNTTSLSRTLWSLDSNLGVEKAVASLVRRGGDPMQDSRGPINSIVPVTEIPSHHGPDVVEVMPHLDITTLAVKVPTTISHLHMINVDLSKEVSREDVIKIFEETPRVRLFSAEEGYDSTAKIIEKFRDKRLRYDMPEVAVWKETVETEGNRLYWIHQVHQESIIVPENVDAIRSMFGTEEKKESIRKTNENLGIK